MLEGAVELLIGLVVSAVCLLMGISLVGSTVAALRAVSRGSHGAGTRRRLRSSLVSPVIADGRNVRAGAKL
jgi:hypothetical protein